MWRNLDVAHLPSGGFVAHLPSGGFHIWNMNYVAHALTEKRPGQTTMDRQCFSHFLTCCPLLAKPLDEMRRNLHVAQLPSLGSPHMIYEFPSPSGYWETARTKVCPCESEISDFDLCDLEKIGQIKNLFNMLESFVKGTHHKNSNAIRPIVREISPKMCFSHAAPY